MGSLERVVRSGRFFNVFQARIKSVGMPITWAEAILRPTLGYVGLKAGNVEREEGDVSSAWRGAWRYSWPTELGTPVQANSASAGPSGNWKGVKGSSVCVTRPILFRPQTGSRSRRRVTGFPSEPYPLAATNGQRKQERRRKGGGGWRWGGGGWGGCVGRGCGPRGVVEAPFGG